MKHFGFFPARFPATMIAAVGAVGLIGAQAQEKAISRKADEDVNNSQLRASAGLVPGTNLLFNGWGVTPVGEHVRISDLALKLAVCPDKKRLLAASGGFSRTGLTLLDIGTRKVTQFLWLPNVWNGLVFSKDGRRVFVSGGSSGKIHVFTYADGKASPAEGVKPEVEGPVFLAPKGKGWRVSNLSRTYSRLRDNAGLPKDLVLYLARHECGTKICRENGIEYARRLLGHTNISTTQRYMHLDDRDLAEAQDLVE